MQTFQFGEWKIEVDVEATQEFCRTFDDDFSNRLPVWNSYTKPTEFENTQREKVLQVYRNYKKFCAALSDEEMSGFNSFGIQPDCVFHFDSIGMRKKEKSLLCSGFYPVVGSCVTSLEDVLQARGDDWTQVPAPQVMAGPIELMLFPGQEGTVYDDLPESIKGSAVLLMFTAEIPWLLDEVCALVYSDPPKRWEFGKKIAFARKSDSINNEYRESIRQGLHNAASPGVAVDLTDKEAKRLRSKWFQAFVPSDKRWEARKHCFSTLRCGNLLWHAFSYGDVPCYEGDDARTLFDAEDKSAGVYLMVQEGSRREKIIACEVDGTFNLKSREIDKFLDIYVIDRNFKYTYVHTHEDSMGLGPYFYRKKQNGILEKLDARRRFTRRQAPRGNAKPTYWGVASAGGISPRRT